MKSVAALLTALALAGVHASLARGDLSSRSIKVVDHQPVTVKGARFHPGERLTVTLRLSGRHTQTVRAGRTGSFVARFAQYAELCTAYTVRALGARGASSTVRHRPPRSCAALDPVR